MSTTVTIAYLSADGARVACPDCHSVEEPETTTQRLCRRDVEADVLCSECGVQLLNNDRVEYPEPPNAWDDGGGKEAYYALKYPEASGWES